MVEGKSVSTIAVDHGKEGGKAMEPCTPVGDKGGKSGNLPPLGSQRAGLLDWIPKVPLSDGYHNSKHLRHCRGEERVISAQSPQKHRI